MGDGPLLLKYPYNILIPCWNNRVQSTQFYRNMFVLAVNVSQQFHIHCGQTACCWKLVQIKSNHFYCHITTAQVPWWVKFLWACSRQCKKTTDNLPMDRQCKKTTNNLPMDRQCKKTTNNLPMDRQCKKTTNNLHMDRQCKKTALEHLQCSRQCKKKQQQFTYGQTVQKKQQQFTYGQTVQKTTAIYIWTVHIYRLYRRQCAKYTYIYSVRLVYYRDILNYQRHIIHRMGTSTLCTVSIHNVVYT